MCKFEKYENCDPETKDRVYCIFHKPNKTKEEAKEFYKKFLEKFRPRVEWTHMPGEEVEEFVFEEIVDCTGYIFPNIPEDIRFQFSHVTFEKMAIFNKATFEGDMYLSEVTFNDKVSFEEANFKGELKFSFANFKEESLFRWAVFEKANFRGAVFEKVDFSSAKFQKADFLGATFYKYANFRGATFKGDAIFRRVAFKSYADFSNASFQGDADFSEATFGNFAYFNRIPSGRKYKFEGKLSFSRAIFHKGLDIDLLGKYFRLPEAEREACRVQRLFYEKEGRKENADRMFVRERRANRKAKTREAKEKLNNIDKQKNRIARFTERLKASIKLFTTCTGALIEWLLADLTCEYGTNWKRPVIIWAVVVLLLFPALFMVGNGIRRAGDLGYVKCFGEYLYFSVVTATTLGYGDYQPSCGVYQLLAGLEAIFGTFMWVIFITIFARKYMR